MSIRVREVTDQEVAQFDQDGVLILRNLVPEADARAMHAEYSRHRAGASTNGGFGYDQGADAASPLIRSLTRDSELPARAARLLHANRIRLYTTQLFTKEPGAALPVRWHHDLPYSPVKEGGPNTGMLAVWIALSDVDADMGPINFMKGSHRWGRWFKPLATIPDDVKSEALKAVKQKMESDAANLEVCPNFSELNEKYPGAINGLLVATLKPGDAVIFTGLTAHGSFANTSQKQRMGVQIRYISEHLIFHPHPNTDVHANQMEALTPGKPIDGYYPLVWAKDPADFERDRARPGPRYEEQWYASTVNAAGEARVAGTRMMGPGGRGPQG